MGGKLRKPMRVPDALRQERSPAWLFVTQRGRTVTPFGLTRDLSTTGIFVETPERPTVGSHHEVALVWGNESLRCKVRVVRHAGDGIGLAFMSPNQVFLMAVSHIVHGRRGPRGRRWAPKAKRTSS